MQKGREVQDRGFGDFGFHSSMMMPSLFGGRDPFDDPFFNDPFDRMWDPTSSVSSRSMQKYREKGVVIQELDCDDENSDNFDEKISRSTMEPSIEHPDDDEDDDANDDVNETENSGVTYKNDHHKSKEPSKDHNRNMSFRTSKVTYGGIDGAYYTSTRTRRMGADGVVMEESKEADTSTGEATHRITRGINDKGHSVLRKLDSDGKVDMTQMLHNLNEDELLRFEDAWKGNNLGPLPDSDVLRQKDSRVGEVNKNKVWSLPSLEQDRRARGFTSNYETGNNSGGRAKKVVRINIE